MTADGLLRDLVMCRKQPGIAIGRLCDKCDGKCPVCDSYVRPTTLVRICDECSFGNYQNKCVVCGGEVWLELFMLFLRCTKRTLGNFWCFLLFWVYTTRKRSRWLPKNHKSWKLKNRSVLPTQATANIKIFHRLRFGRWRFYGLPGEMVCCNGFTAEPHTSFVSIPIKSSGLFINLDSAKNRSLLQFVPQGDVGARHQRREQDIKPLVSCEVISNYFRPSAIYP